MSPVAHIPSRRKPRRTASSWALRTGVAGGVLSTLAVTGAAAPASAAEKPAESTLEMPTVDATLAASISQSADATQQTAHAYQVRAEQEAAAHQAKIQAKKVKDEADRKAEAEKKAAAAKKAKAEKEAKAADEAARASRSAGRTQLSTASASASSSGSAASSSSAPSTSHATGSAATLISFLQAQIGKPYVMGATGSSSYDCSGLTQAAYRQIGIDLPRVSQDQSTAGTPVSLGNLQPGDLLYWGSAGSAYHVAVYIGGGKFIGAQNPSTGIVERSLSYSQPTGAVRVM
ncbi:C40 family peptidase [Streptomyces varsoviensis]|uniref:C40 family peptidase n=1 Tax=Streptomyces varsoviensis TaxID=67373 RepID=UPI0033F0392B